MADFNKIAEKVFKLLKGRGYKIKVFDETGAETVSPSTGRRFFVLDPNMMITVNDELESITMNKNSNYPIETYEDLKNQLRDLVNHNMITFTLKDYAKEIQPRDSSYQVKQNKDYDMSSTISEGALSGSKRTSYQIIENVRLIVKHNRDINEEVRGSRSRNISAIFLESSGERFRFPHKHLGGARAMARHVARGGSMQDMVGEHISESTGDYIKLREFMRYVRSNKLINEDTEESVSAVKSNMRHISESLKKLTGVKTYEMAKSRIEEDTREELNEQDIDGLRDIFTVKRFDEKFSDILPLVGKMVQENQSFLKRIEESASSQVLVTSKLSEDCFSHMEFDSREARFGAKIKEMASRIVENEELKGYVQDLGTKIVKEGALSSFETAVITSVFENITVQEASVEKSEGIFESAMNRIDESFSKYTPSYLVESGYASNKNSVTTVTNDDGIEFNVRIVKKGEPYGRNDSLTAKHDMVEFYDSRYPDPSMSGGGYGQFVSSYYIDTIKNCQTGINLNGGVDAWHVSKGNIDEIKAFIGSSETEVDEGFGSFLGKAAASRVGSKLKGMFSGNWAKKAEKELDEIGAELKSLLAQAKENGITESPESNPMLHFRIAINMFLAARKGLGFANKLKSEKDKKKHASRVLSNMNKLRAEVNKLRQMVGMEKDQSKDSIEYTKKASDMFSEEEQLDELIHPDVTRKLSLSTEEAIEQASEELRDSGVRVSGFELADELASMGYLTVSPSQEELFLSLDDEDQTHIHNIIQGVKRSLGLKESE